MKEITHIGKILQITPELTSVEIVSESACSACHAKGLCSLGESKQKVIELPTARWEDRKVGDEVTVVLKASMGHKAVWISYVIPLILLVAALEVLAAAGCPELVCGLGGIGAVALWYVFVGIFSSKLKNEYIFTIKND